MYVISSYNSRRSWIRLWPLSRQSRPKQFLALGQNKFSMLETTLARIASLKYAKPFVVCNESHRFLVAESLRKLGKLQRNIILEPLQKILLQLLP